MDVESVRSLPSDAWKRVRPSAAGNLGFVASDVWVRLPLRGGSSPSGQYVVELAFARTDFVDWHRIRPGEPTQTGYSGSMRERPAGLAGARFPAFSLSIPPGEEAEVVVRLASETVLHLKFWLWAMEDYAVYAQRRESGATLLLGIAFTLIFFSYLLAWGMRDAVAFLFPLAFTFILAAMANLAGFWLDTPWLSPAFRVKTMMLASTSWGLALLLLHARSFYGLSGRRPTLSRCVAGVSFSMLLLGLFVFFAPFRVGVLLVHLTVLATLLMVVLIALTSLSRAPSAWIYFFAYLLFYAHTLTLLPYIRGWTNLPVLAEVHSLMAVAASMALFILALVLRMREIRREHQQAQGEALEQRELRARDQQALVHDLHDGLGGMAANISMMAALGQCAAAPNDKDEQLVAIERMAIHAAGEIRAMMNMLEQNNVLWTDWARELYDYVEQVFKPTALAVEWRVSGDALARVVSAASSISLMRAIKEAVQNVVKHSGANRLFIELDFGPDALAIRVRDNGRGFDPALQGPGKGLASIRRRVQALGGRVAFRPQPTGMEVAMDLPLPLKYPIGKGDKPVEPGS